MNCNIARGKWQQLKGKVEVQWGRMTRDQLLVVTGRHLQMVGRLDAAYFAAQADIRRELDGVHQRSRASRSRLPGADSAAGARAH